TLEQAVNNALDFYQTRTGGPKLDIFLQLLAMEKKTVHLKVFDNDDRHGSFFFRKGYLIDAEQGDMMSDDAVLEMLEWRNIRLSMNEFRPSAMPPDTTDCSSRLMPLLSGICYHRTERYCASPG
ncbi:MAG: DUF4388 domain-containing protein, partial [Candidatus Electrothrix sp. EH2]|nr:DUF4388 domain-containing protein [Candidatus Electrothrix sp. EH2]